MLQIAVHEKTYMLAAGLSMDELKQAVLYALRAAPSFLTLHTALGGQVEVAITATTAVVLEEHEEEPLSLPTTAGNADAHYDDLYGLDYL